MSSKKFFLLTINLFLITILGLSSINYFIDSYGVFSKKLKNYTTTNSINIRYLKTKYILNNPTKYDSFIIGSSRVGTFRGDKLQKIGNFYNMSYNVSLPNEEIHMLEEFLQNNIKIKNIILGINDFDFYTNPEEQVGILYKIPYTELKNKFNLLKYYLFINPFNPANKATLWGKKDQFYDIIKTGYWNCRMYMDKNIEKDLKKHKKYMYDIRNNIKNVDIDRISTTIQEIGEIVNLCKKENINLTIIYLPIYHPTYLVNKKLIDNSKTELQKITDFWDFSNIPVYCKEEYYWYEDSHFRPMLSDAILKTIFKENFDLIPALDTNKNFGIFLRKQ